MNNYEKGQLNKESVKTESSSESFEDRFEKEGFVNMDRVVVKGSAALALMSGKDLKLARDVDVFFINDGFERNMDVQTFDSFGLAKEELPGTASELIEPFVLKHGLEDRPIQIVQVSRSLLRDCSMFVNEPEAVLWDYSLEMKKKFLKPIDEDEKKGLLEKLSWSGKIEDPEAIMRSIEDAHDLQLYQTGNLYRGKIPAVLCPSNERLVVALRLIDLGERFGIEVDDIALRRKDRQAKIGDIMLASPAYREKETSLENKPDEGYEQDFQVERTGAIDIAFCNVAKKEGIKELLAKRYPALASLSQKIEEAGGLREFIKNEYGEIYLEREYISLRDPSFSGSGLLLNEQRIILNVWNNETVTDLFAESGQQNFVKACTELNKTTPISQLSEGYLIKTICDTRLAVLLESKNPRDRESAYKTMDRFLSYKDGKPEDYQSLKETMKRALLKERSPDSRSILIEGLAKLVKSGDLTIAGDLAAFVKKESMQLRVGKNEKKSANLLSPEGMRALRALFSFDHRDSHRVVLDLLVNPKVNERVKKTCLSRLFRLEGFKYHDFDRIRILQDHLEMDSKAIPWEDYMSIVRVESIASRSVREKINKLAGYTFASIYEKEESISEAKNKIAPQLPWEFFLAIYNLSRGDIQQIKAWEEIIVGTKSNKLRESFLNSVADLPPKMFCLVTEKIIKSSQITKEHILLTDRLIKKILFLYSVENQGTKVKSDASSQDNVFDLLKEAKAPSLLELKLDEKIVTGLCELTKRGDLTSSKIQSLFQVWGNPEPFLLYIASLATQFKSDHQKKTIQLVGEMLANIDPEEMIEWKKWRYDRQNPVVAEQLRGLSDNQVEAYAEDQFTDLGEVLVSLLPSDRPERIRQEIFHAFVHDWPESGMIESRSIMRLFPNVRATLEQKGKFDAENVLIQDINGIDSKIQVIKNWLDLQEDQRLSLGLNEQLAVWRRNEIQKTEKLKELGYRGNESAQEINELVARLKASKEDPKKISQIVKLQPNTLPLKIQSLLDRRSLSSSASPEDIESLRQTIAEDIENLQIGQEFVGLQQELFGKKQAEAKDWQGAMRELRSAQLFLKLGVLSPQLIAFNKISPEKKKASLGGSIQFLEKHFTDSEAVVKTIDRIKAIIEEEGHAAGKDHLVVIFTDNPLAMLSIGKFPSGAESCQEYRNGSLALAAYAADAYTKMMLLVDLDKLPPELQSEIEKTDDSRARLEIFRENVDPFLNASVARRVTKIVRDNISKEPQLFLEPAYSNITRESATQILNAFAVAQLKPKLGIELVRGGGNNEVFVAESRNSYQYEDGETGGPGGYGGGLGQKQGSYTMLAQKITEADYLARI